MDESDEEQKTTAYSWEDEYHRSWDAVQEDTAGSLAHAVSHLVESAKRRRATADARPVRRGIIRNLVLVLDESFAMAETDLRPTRHTLMLTLCAELVNEFFTQNPISQLAIVTMREGLAKLVSPLDSSPETHLSKLAALRKVDPAGVPSLQNALEAASVVLAHVPQHCTREVLVVFGALISSDPGDIYKTIEKLVREKVRVRVIGLAAQVAVCQRLAQQTSGTSTAYSVVLNEQHLRDLVLATTTPLALAAAPEAAMSAAVQMGFPSRSASEVLCACHGRNTSISYECPKCRSKVCSLPSVCPVCNLTLVMSTHLARSYHHLFPLATFVQKEAKGSCAACHAPLVNHGYACVKCSFVFCVDCDVFCHETLHCCPKCEALTD